MLLEEYLFIQGTYGLLVVLGYFWYWLDPAAVVVAHQPLQFLDPHLQLIHITLLIIA